MDDLFDWIGAVAIVSLLVSINYIYLHRRFLRISEGEAISKLQRSMLNFFSILRISAFVVLIVVLVHNFFFIPTRIEGRSMSPTLHDQDYVLTSRFNKEPSLFQVLIFEQGGDQNYVKRVIGLPGQDVFYLNDVLYIDGEPFEEPFIEDVANESGDTWSSVNTPDFTLQSVCDIDGRACDVIPEGYYLVLGDNRRHSQDSRRIGLIHEDAIIGRVLWIQWPLDRFGPIR